MKMSDEGYKRLKDETISYLGGLPESILSKREPSSRYLTKDMEVVNNTIVSALDINHLSGIIEMKRSELKKTDDYKVSLNIMNQVISMHKDQVNATLVGRLARSIDLGKMTGIITNLMDTDSNNADANFQVRKQLLFDTFFVKQLIGANVWIDKNHDNLQTNNHYDYYNSLSLYSDLVRESTMNANLQLRALKATQSNTKALRLRQGKYNGK